MNREFENLTSRTAQDVIDALNQVEEEFDTWGEDMLHPSIKALVEEASLAVTHAKQKIEDIRFLKENTDA